MEEKYGESTIQNKNSFIEYDKLITENIIKRFSEYTHGLDKIIPWNNSIFVWCGELLFNSIYGVKKNNIFMSGFYQNLTIDLYFLKNNYSENKKTIEQLISNLHLNNNEFMLFTDSENNIIITIKNFPCIQIFFMYEKSFDDLVVDFDFYKGYFDGEKFYNTKQRNRQINLKNPNITPFSTFNFY